MNPDTEEGRMPASTPADGESPEWWAAATAPIPAGYITFEQVAALTGYTGADEPTARELTFPLAGDTARRCKLLRRPDDAGDPCACGLMFQRFPSCELLRAIDAGGSFRAEDHAGPGACAGLDGRCPECIALYLALVGPTLPVCIPCGHKHWPWEAHADHQWRDACPYEGTACDTGAGPR